jgi:hypothetical protein
MKLLLLINLLILSLQAATHPYSVVIKSPFNDTLYSVVEDYDGGISAVGFYKNFNTSKSSVEKSYTNPFDYLAHVSSTHGIDMQLIKMNKHAKIVFKKTLHVGEFSKAVALTKTSDDGYFVGGYTLDGHLVVAKLDQRGEKLFVKVFGKKHFDTMKKMIALSSGGVLVVGSSMSQVEPNDSIYNGGLGQSDIMVTRISADGKILWSKKFGTMYNDTGIDAVQGSDGTVIVLGTTSEGKKSKIVLMRISHFGTLLWYKTYLDKTFVKPYCMTALQDHNYLISFDTLDENHEKQINLTKFDGKGNIVQHVLIHTEYPSALLDLKEDRNGYIIGVGKVTDNNYQDTDALLMKLSGSLKPLYKKHYGSAYYDLFRGVTVLRNGDYVAVGSRSSTHSQISNMWIVKLDPNGTIAQK